MKDLIITKADNSTLHDYYKKVIANVILHTCGQKKYEDLEIISILNGSNEISFPGFDEENLDSRLFAGYIRANKEFTKEASNLIEILLFPIHAKVHVNNLLYVVLSEPNKTDSYLSRVISSYDCRINFQRYIKSVEKELLNSDIIDTNIRYEDFIKRYQIVKNKSDRHILVAYLLSYIIEHAQIGPLSKTKIKIIKNILRKINGNY